MASWCALGRLSVTLGGPTPTAGLLQLLRGKPSFEDQAGLRTPQHPCKTAIRGRTNGLDLSAKKSRTTLSWTSSWYRRETRASSFLDFCSCPLPTTPVAPSVRAFFQAWICLGRTSYRAANWATVSRPLSASSATLAWKAGCVSCLPATFPAPPDSNRRPRSRSGDYHLATCPKLRVNLRIPVFAGIADGHGARYVDENKRTPSP